MYQLCCENFVVEDLMHITASPPKRKPSSTSATLDYVIAGSGDTDTLIARRSTGRWHGIGAHACSRVECRAHYAVVIRSGGE
jgi:hypothetical protein